MVTLPHMSQGGILDGLHTFTMHTIHLVTHKTAGAAYYVCTPDLCICSTVVALPHHCFVSYVIMQDYKAYTDIKNGYYFLSYMHKVEYSICCKCTHGIH